MKRFLSFAFAAMLSIVPVVAFAADSLFVPSVPEFLIVSGNTVTSRLDFDTSSSSAVSFFSSFYNSPHLIAVSQGTSTDYYPEDSPNREFVGSDKKWWIHFIKIQSPSFGYLFSYRKPSDNFSSMNASPLRVASSSSQYKLTTFSYAYDYENKKFLGSSYRSALDYLDISYVVGSSATSGSSITYPYFSHVGGVPIDVTTSTAGYSPHYNWWIGSGNVAFDPSSPPILPPIDPPVDPLPDPSNPYPLPPNWDNIKPDNPFELFDPEVNNDGYKPPKNEAYDPLPPNYQPPPMPEFPTSMPEFDNGGNNPFAPPTFDDSGNNPFAPPTFDDSVNNPFAPPTFDDSGNNPFAPPTFDDSGNNPFAPPTFDDSGNNPFAPPTFDDGGNNPFAPPTFDDSGNNPFAPPIFDDGGFSPFKSTPKVSYLFNFVDWYKSLFGGALSW